MIHWGFQVVDNVPNRILGSTGLVRWANHLVLVPCIVRISVRLQRVVRFLDGFRESL
jgi:hypothetical protein